MDASCDIFRLTLLRRNNDFDTKETIAIALWPEVPWRSLLQEIVPSWNMLSVSLSSLNFLANSMPFLSGGGLNGFEKRRS